MHFVDFGESSGEEDAFMGSCRPLLNCMANESEEYVELLRDNISERADEMADVLDEQLVDRLAQQKKENWKRWRV